MAGLLAELVVFILYRRGGCSAVPSPPPPGAPPFASGGTGAMVDCRGGPEVLWLLHAALVVSVAIVGVLLVVVLVQAITGRRLLWPMRPPVRPRLFALGVAIMAVATALVAVEAIAPPMAAVAGLATLSTPLLLAGVAIIGFGQAGTVADGRRLP